MNRINEDEFKEAFRKTIQYFYYANKHDINLPRTIIIDIIREDKKGIEDELENANRKKKILIACIAYRLNKKYIAYEILKKHNIKLSEFMQFL